MFTDVTNEKIRNVDLWRKNELVSVFHFACKCIIYMVLIIYRTGTYYYCSYPGFRYRLKITFIKLNIIIFNAF